MHHFMAEMLNLKKNILGRGCAPTQTPPQLGRGHSLPIPHLLRRLRRLSAPSPDVEPSHFSFVSDAYRGEGLPQISDMCFQIHLLPTMWPDMV